MKIAVVGCGIGGQAAALFLKRAGHAVEIFERFPEAKPLGAGLMLQPPGQAALEKLGLLDELLPKGARVDRLFGRTTTGRTVLNLAYADHRADYFGLGIHRAHLFDALHNAIRAEKIAVHLEAPIADIGNTGKPTLVIEGGATHGPFDLVVIAEGARSHLRRKINPRTYDPVYPWGALWTTCPDPKGHFAGTLWQVLRRADKMIGVLPIGLTPEGGATPHVALFWSLRNDSFPQWQRAGLAAWKAEILMLWPEIAPLIEHISHAEQMTLASYSDVVLQPWRQGRCVLIGDAAHGTSPQLGQGANLALIDAWTLASTLAGVDEIEASLARYERIRRPHVNYYQLSSRWLTPFFQSRSRVLPAARDVFMGPLCRLPLTGDMMVTTLSGVRCLPLGLWQPPV